MDVSIITVGWNSEQFLHRQLKSIFTSNIQAKFEVFVVDNDSSDNTVATVRKHFPEVHLITNTQNLGFAKANNQAIAQAQGRYVLLLNPDMRLEYDTLVNMIRFMDTNSNVGVGGCKLVDQDGEVLPHVRKFPTVLDQAMIMLKVPHLFPSILNTYLMKSFDYTQEAEVDSVRGSFFMIRQEVIEQIGGLDERYFIWFEEVDYCKQVWNAGWKVMYTPAARCMDYVGRSFSLVSGLQKQKYFTNSMITYFMKWHKAVAWILMMLKPVALFLAWIGEQFSPQSYGKRND